MSQNDNIRHYIGDLETTEDIDLVFKHIYDLMLANGGEGSGLNADMVDGHHASDFAPADIKDEIDNAIHSITWAGKKYTGKDVILQILAREIDSYRATTAETIDVNTFLNEMDRSVKYATDLIELYRDVLDFLHQDKNKYALQSIINNNVETVEYDDETSYYLNADSVNGISLRIMTQKGYDSLPNNIKEDPRNLFIINDEIDDDWNKGRYVPPSILHVGTDLEFTVNGDRIFISFDKGKTWKQALPIVGDKTNNGVMYPTSFLYLKNVIENEGLVDQSTYPFILNTPDNLQRLENSISSIDFGIGSVTPDDHGAAHINNMLGLHEDRWLETKYDDIGRNIVINPSQHGLETVANKVDTIESPGNRENYPSTQAVVSYTDRIQQQINNINTVLSGKQDKSGLTWVNDWNRTKSNTNYYVSGYHNDYDILIKFYWEVKYTQSGAYQDVDPYLTLPSISQPRITASGLLYPNIYVIAQPEGGLKFKEATGKGGTYVLRGYFRYPRI